MNLSQTLARNETKKSTSIPAKIIVQQKLKLLYYTTDKRGKQRNTATRKQKRWKRENETR